MSAGIVTASIAPPAAPVWSFRPEGEFTIYRVSDAFAEFKSALAGEGEIRVDLSAVTEIDTAGMQLLLFVQRRGGARVRFGAFSSAVTRALESARATGLLARGISHES